MNGFGYCVFFRLLLLLLLINKIYDEIYGNMKCVCSRLCVSVLYALVVLYNYKYKYPSFPVCNIILLVKVASIASSIWITILHRGWIAQWQHIWKKHVNCFWQSWNTHRWVNQDTLPSSSFVFGAIWLDTRIFLPFCRVHLVVLSFPLSFFDSTLMWLCLSQTFNGHFSLLPIVY